jgi:hypothetical protein
MATFVKFQAFTNALALGTHGNLHTATIMAMLTNTAPNSTTFDEKADITEISAGNGYSAGGFDTQNAVSSTGGVASITGVDYTMTASGGSIGPYRYLVLYNDTATGDPLIGYWDKGSSVTLTTGQSDLFDFASSLFTIT